MIAPEALDSDPDGLRPALRFLAGGGEATRLILARDWSGHPLGPPETWPEALKVSLSLILNSPESMIICWGRDELTFFFNETYFPLLGPRLPWAMGEKLEIVWADAWAQAKPIIDEAFAGRAERFIDLPWTLDTDRGARETWWTFSYSRVLGADGEIAGLFIFTNETTASVLARAAAREGEARLLRETERQRLSLQQMPGFVALLAGRDHVFEYVNDAYTKLAGLRDFIGRPVREVFPELEGQGFYELLERVYATGEGFNGRALPVRLAGEHSDRFIDLLYQPIRDDGGAVTGIFVGGYDITDQVRTERRQHALLKLEERLHDVADTAELSFAACELLGEALGASRVGYGTLDARARTVTVERNWSAPGFASVAGTHKISDYGSFIDELLVGHRVLNRDVETDPRTAESAPAFRSLGIRAHLDVSVIEDGQAVAMMFIHSDRPRLWTKEEADLVSDFAERTRVTIERRRAEHRLAESEERYRQIVEGAEDFAIVTLDDAGAVTGWNSGAERLTGFAAADALGRPGAIFFTPEDRERGVPEQERERARSEGRAVDERWHQRADGSRFWGSGLMMRLAGSGYLKMFRDRTAEHEADLRARESEEQFRVFAQAMPNHVWASRPDGDLYWFNDQVYAYSGEETGSLNGSNWARIVHPDDLPNAATVWMKALGAGEVYETEFRIRRADGVYRWFLVRAEPVRDVEGSIVNWIGTNTDIEDQRRQAAELEALNANLEQQVQERTGELMAAEEALRQSQKMEAVGQLTGGLAHDFNNLLAGITGSLELLGRRMAQGRMVDAERYIAAAQGAAKRASSLTHRLLAFSRRQTLDPKPTDVNRLVAGMDELVRRTVGPAIQVEVVAAGGLWPTMVDPNQLENALLNLCINARDAMPEGGKLTIETANRWLDKRGAREREIQPGQYISMCVSDNGCGMSPDVAAKAFDPFFTTKPIGQGTGLGLSMIYGFARQSGGQARIYSEPGSGTMVCLYLPRHHGVAEEDHPVSELAEAPRAQAGETVLVVDDEPTVRMLVTEVLEELGYAAIEAADGPSGLKVLQSDVRIDLLVTDVGLPGGMNGRQMADAARNSRRDLKVLFITGYAENAVIGHGHLEPGMHVMTKPFSLDALASRIKELIAPA